MSDDPVRDPLPPVLTHSTLNLLAGASGVGKTALIAYMAAAFKRGTLLLGHQPAPVPAVGYIGADRAWTNDSARWFAKVGLTEDDIPHYAIVEDPAFDTTRLRLGTLPKAKASPYAALFAEHVDKLALPPGSVLFVDPIALYVGANMNDYVKCAMGCIDLQRIIRQRSLCVIGVDHSGKQKGGDDSYTRLQDRIGGSMAKLGYTSTQMYLAGPEEMGESHHTFLWNPHHARTQTFTLKQDTETGLFRVLGEAEDAPHEDTPEVTGPVLFTEPMRAVLAALPDPPAWISTSQLVTQFGAHFHRATLFRALKQLEKSGLAVQPQHGAWSKAQPAQPLAKVEPPSES